MREEHPIDDRFKALYDTEVDPPGSVRTALASRLGWQRAPETRFAWRSKLITMTMVVAFSAAIGLWIDRTVPFEEHELSNADAHGSLAPRDPLNGPEQAGPDVTLPSSSIGREQGSLENRPTTDRRPATTGMLEGAGGSRSGSHPLPAKADPRTHLPTPHGARDLAAQNRSGTVPATPSMTGDRPITRVPVPSPEATDPVLDAASTASPAGVAFADPAVTVLSMDGEVPVTWLDPRPVSMERPMEHARIGAPGAYGYVLPNGTWWVGPFLGIGGVRGEWTGQGVEELQASEQWRSTDQAGLYVGRSWRSGWGVASGVGIARVRSVFSHESTSTSQGVLDVDTTWVMNTYNDSPYSVYTWSIDSLIETYPGSVVRQDARNTYSAIMVPVMLSWHGMAHRVHYGAFGGVTAWIPSRREGLTLVGGSTDPGSTTTDLQDERVDTRFRTQLHGQLGASVGYSVMEDLGIFLEPMISVPITLANEQGAPWLTRSVLQIRLQYDLRSSPR